MSEAHEDWHFEIGDTWAIMFACQNVDGTPMVLDGSAEIFWRIADKFKLDTLFELTRDDGISIISVPLGQCVVTVSPERTSMLTPGRYYDELTVIRGGTFTLAKGVIIAESKLPE